MKYAFFSRLLPVITVIAISLTTLPASASVYDQMVVFGDSLSDSGNNTLVPGIGSNAGQVITGNTYVPSQTYASKVYSNGPVWATDAAAKLGLPLAPSLAGGTNYAFGGATTGGVGLLPSLVDQANLYLATKTVSANALYVIAGGGNDARAALGAIAACGAVCPTVATTIAATAAQFAANVGSIVDKLQAAGAQHIIVWNTPNLGLAPAVATVGASSLGTILAASMNAALAARLQGEFGVTTFDIFGLGTSIAQNPGAFGFTNVSDACGAKFDANHCSAYAYWDGIHPTAAAHEIIAEAFVAAAVPETSTWIMMFVGFACIGFVTYRRQKPAALTSA